MLDPQRVEDIMNKLDEHDLAIDAVSPAQSPAAATETVTSGNLSATAAYSRLSVTGAQAYTLPNGTADGQMKTIECTVAATIPVGTLTITTAAGSEPTVHVFNSVGQRLVLQWNGSGWHHLEKRRTGALSVVVGTTVLTGLDMNAEYQLSVTGTVSSTGNKAIPNGCVPGEEIHVSTPTAATIPNGNINIAGTTIATAVAATNLAGINATSCTAHFVWDQGGTNSWQNTALTTATYS
jgi:hypothetical protein